MELAINEMPKFQKNGVVKITPIVPQQNENGVNRTFDVDKDLKM
jgi:hypothetical protein